MVYKLVQEHKLKGNAVFTVKKPGRPRLALNSTFIQKVVELRQTTDYGSEKIHFTLCKSGFVVSQRQVQRVLDEKKLTRPCPKRRGQRSYVRYQWPISNYMWHTDWSEYQGRWYLVFIDDRSRKIMGAGVFTHATTDNALFLLRHTILTHEVCPAILLSDKGTQFYNSTKNKKGERTLGDFEKAVASLGIDFWTSRRNHPQTNGKMEKWFDTMKKGFRIRPELSEFVAWYNEERIHHALNYKTPNEVYKENL